MYDWYLRLKIPPLLRTTLVTVTHEKRKDVISDDYANWPVEFFLGDSGELSIPFTFEFCASLSIQVLQAPNIIPLDRIWV